MKQATVDRRNGRTLLVLDKKQAINYNIHKKLVTARFYVPDFDTYWIWVGPDTDRAEALANELAEQINGTS